MNTKFKKTTRLVLTALTVMLSITLTQAQPGGQKGGQQGPPPIPDDKQIEEMVSDLSKELSLSETQEEQVSKLYFSHFEVAKEKRETQKTERDAERKEMEQFRSDFETEVKSVLTKDQQKEFDAYMKEKKPQRGGKGKPKQ